MRTALAVTGVFAALFCFASADKPKRFCPQRDAGFECRSDDETVVKCGVFYEYLWPDRELTWIGVLPDSIKRGRTEEEKRKILGTRTLTSFTAEKYPSDQTPNNFCYPLFSNLINKKLDTCTDSVLHPSFSGTVGDQLCQQARRYLEGTPGYNAENGLRNQRITFRYTFQKGPWEPISSEGKTVELIEPLCCNFVNEPAIFERCDGSGQKNSC